ncbi:MAG: hypothetical protein MI919_30835 [Holophagales bacterium]|nr:hypothetical protein [Holophagales bacterium]
MLAGLCLLALGGSSIAAAAVPPVPDDPTPTCEAEVDGQCYVKGPFAISASSPGADHYRICRSNDTLGWGGCQVVVTHNSGPSFTITGGHLPSDGFRRAYYFSACDASNQCTSWGAGNPAYVRMDTSAPVQDSLSVYDASWTIDDGSAYKITLRATDTGSGVGEVLALINYQGSNTGNRRGLFSWRHETLSYQWGGDQIACDGGGFASKHPSKWNPTTVTLVDCTTFLDGDQRIVNLTVEPDSSFGVFGPINDISFWARDLVRNGTSWQNFDLDFGSQLADGLGDGIGYAGILDAAGLRQSLDEGIGGNIATLLYQRKECAAFYWRTVDTAAILDAYAEQNVKAMVILENFLMKDVNDPQGEDCQDLVPPPVIQPTDCFRDQKWRLLSDWQARLDEFEALHGVHLSPDNTAFFLISSEVNDRCFDEAEVEQVAVEVRKRFPGIPIAFIYGATHNRHGVRISQPPPADFPKIYDIVGLFSYDNYDIADPLEPRNATGTYYNPLNPQDPTTIYGDLLGKLEPHQKVLLVFDSEFVCGNQLQGWIPDDLGIVALNYADFLRDRPEATLMGGGWRGLRTLPPLVKDTHALMACEDFVNDSPTCAGRGIDFDDYTIEGYGGAGQAGNPTVTVEDGGATLHIVGNGWRKIQFPYTVTENTVLEFDFRSTSQGDVHGIGFEIDDTLTANRHFQVYGTQAWGNDHNDYAGFAPAWKRYVIPVGQQVSGEQLYLTFANDHDVAGATGESYYRNVRVYQAYQDVLDLNNFTIEGYGGAGQAGNPTVTVEDGGATLRIVGNGWRKIHFPYTVTENTVLEFDFRSSVQGEVHGVGFDVDDTLSADRLFQVHGTQAWGIPQKDWGIPQNEIYACWAPSWRHYVVPVGRLFTGGQLYLTFANDHDVAGANGESYYSNIRIHE